MNIHRYLVAVACLALLSLNCSAKLKVTNFDCVTNHLKSENMLERQYSVKPMNATSKSECDAELKETRDDFYAQISEVLKEDDELASSTDCIVEHLRQFKLAEVSMKLLLLEGNSRMSKRKRKKAMKALDYTIEKKTEVAVKLCLSDEAFSELFDTLYDNCNATKNASDNTPEEDYCLRKYMTDKNFINSTLYKINLNPENVDVSKLDCEEIVKTLEDQEVEALKEEFKDELEQPSKKSLKCVGRTIRVGHFFEASAKVSMLGEIGITDEQKAEERKEYIGKMKQLYDNILKC